MRLGEGILFNYFFRSILKPLIGNVNNFPGDQD
jgi:hypothetical protein